MFEFKHAQLRQAILTHDNCNISSRNLKNCYLKNTLHLGSTPLVQQGVKKPCHVATAGFLLFKFFSWHSPAKD
jgi:hypothetical protein